MPNALHANFDPLMEGFLALAQQTAKVARQKYHAATRRRIGATLPPGPETPLWNHLVQASAQLLRRRGDKARLARALGISRQRLHLLLVARTACADAERTLQLLLWLQLHQRAQRR